jgi:hypothetical protein
MNAKLESKSSDLGTGLESNSSALGTGRWLTRQVQIRPNTSKSEDLDSSFDAVILGQQAKMSLGNALLYRYPPTLTIVIAPEEPLRFLV